MTGRSIRDKQSANAAADRQAPESFSARHLRVQFLIAVTMAQPDLWVDLERNYFQEYLRLEKEQYELQIQEEERDWEAGVHPTWAPLVDPDLKRPGQNDLPPEMLEQRVQAELEVESQRALVKYDRVYGGEEENEVDWSRSGKSTTGPGFF
jgi:hypothetical protein